jgi:hypothetical protein
MTEEQLFLDAIELPEADRSAFLSRVCSGNPRLLEKVMNLLNVHESGVVMIDRPCRELKPLPQGLFEYLRKWQ